MNIEEATSVLREALENDEDLFYSWQSNIVAGFSDAYQKKMGVTPSSSMNKLMNEGAVSFLNNLIDK